MSNIYSHEPPTYGKVMLKTSVGDLDIELWSKEAPKACRNFVQLCMEGYYDGTMFHRIVPGFIAQCGDPTGTGHGGESIYGKPFKDEIHSRLRFVRRGLVAMANAGPDDNGSQFFFTLASTPELNKKHTIFGKVAGDTVYNMLKLDECETDSEERPTNEIRINRTKVLSNPFEDIVPRVAKRDKSQDQKKKTDKTSSKATKNFKLLSFGEEAEEDEEATNRVTESMKGKSKSSHDLLEDSKLSSRPAVETSSPTNKRSHLEVQEDSEEDSDDEQVRDSVRKKLKSKHSSPPKHSRKDSSKGEAVTPKKADENDEDRMKNAKLEDLKAEARRLKKEIAASKKGEVLEPPEEPKKAEPDDIDSKSSPDDALSNFKAQRKKYKEMRKNMAKKGSDREKQTLAILSKFKDKLHAANEVEEESTEDKKVNAAGNEDYDDSDEDVKDISWLGHELHFQGGRAGKVLDANIEDIDRYEISDPRNPMTKRRREASKAAQRDKSRGKR